MNAIEKFAETLTTVDYDQPTWQREGRRLAAGLLYAATDDRPRFALVPTGDEAEDRGSSRCGWWR